MKLKPSEITFWERAALAFLGTGVTMNNTHSFGPAAARVADNLVKERRDRLEAFEDEPAPLEPYRAQIGERLHGDDETENT